MSNSEFFVTTTIEGSAYYLPEYVHFCFADDHCVFLDLRSDKYLCLGRTHTDAIRGLLNGHRVVDEHSADIRLQYSRDRNVSAAVEALLQKGLLVQDATDGKLPAPTIVKEPVACLIEGALMPQPKISPTRVWSFFIATATASKNLRRGSIERTVRSVRDRKSGRSSALDNDAVTNLFAIFQTLRPYYPRPYLCMFDSLALLHFLARYDVFPQWVYGVQLEPFAAHCWVQAGDLLVNDIIDNVRNYTPIMSV